MLSGVAARTPDGNHLFDDLTLAFGRERAADLLNVSLPGLDDLRPCG